MSGRATSIDIAYLAGVSQSTVSRALRGSPTVNEETRKRIEEIAHKLNYTVDKNASNLRTQHSNTAVRTHPVGEIGYFFANDLSAILLSESIAILRVAKEGAYVFIGFDGIKAECFRARPMTRRLGLRDWRCRWFSSRVGSTARTGNRR